MTNKRFTRLLLLWIATFFLGSIIAFLIYTQMSINKGSLVTTIEIESNNNTEEDFDNLTQLTEETNEPNPGALGTANISEDTEFSHLIETKSPFWNVFPISSPGVSADNWHTILIQNRSKIDYTITPLAPRDWHLVRNNNSIRIQFRSELSPVKDILARKKRGKFSLQLISVEQERFPLAISLLSRLLNDGHYAYLQRSESKFKGKIWYRVRVGFFKNLEDARSTGKKIFNKYKSDEYFSSKYWPVRPGSQELSRPLIDLSQPLNKPWIIQLPYYKSQAAALEDMAELNHETDFSYVSQKLESDSSGKLNFRIRIGFFETRKEANRKIFSLKKKFSRFKIMKSIHL